LAKLLLVRHGETELKSSQRYWGKTDVNLGTEGLNQAKQLRDRLTSEKIDRVYSSKMQRALVTAQTIALAHQIPVVGCPELNEVDFGEIEGLNFDEINQRFPEVARMWINRSPDLAYPNGETLTQMEARVAKFRESRLQQADNETILIVAHAGILRSLICQLLKLDMPHRWNLRLDLASLSIIETYSDNAILCLFNDTSHLIEKCE
jgi:alpha-ribazole phosphatase